MISADVIKNVINWNQNWTTRRISSDLVCDTNQNIIFRRIVDFDCYALSYEFICQLLQLVCFQVVEV